MPDILPTPTAGAVMVADGEKWLPAVDGDLAYPVGTAAAVDDLAQDISATYVEAEVQAISDKVDEMLGALRAAGLMATE